LDGFKLLSWIGIGIALISWGCWALRSIADALDRLRGDQWDSAEEAFADWAREASACWSARHPALAEVAEYLSRPGAEGPDEFAADLARRYPDTQDGQAAAVRDSLLRAQEAEERLEGLARFLREVSVEASQIHDADIATTRLLSRIMAVDGMRRSNEHNLGGGEARQGVLQDGDPD
jgi:hypothetical protein